MLLFVSVLGTGCAKDGEDGLDGTNGADGAPGQAGTANVIYSTWVTATNLGDSTVDGTLVKKAYIAAPKLTSDLLTSGDVKVYLTFGAGTFVLPYTSNAGGKPNTISYVPMVGKILITRFTHDNSASANLPGSLQYRYVLIPGGTTARAVPIDWNDYAAVAAYLGWTD